MAVTRITPKTRKRAQKLRREMTPPERMLWKHLKALKEQGHRFRRQAPIGPYIADFANFSHKLVIELDGETHAGPDAGKTDAVRDAFLKSQGFAVLRFANHEVVRNCGDVVETILNKVKTDEQ